MEVIILQNVVLHQFNEVIMESSVLFEETFDFLFEGDGVPLHRPNRPTSDKKEPSL